MRNVPKTVNYLKKLVEEKGKSVYIKRLERRTKEVKGVCVTFNIEGFGKFLKDRGVADKEIEDTFIRALKILHEDISARYAVSFSTAFRSMDVEEMPYDIAKISEMVFRAFGRGIVKLFIGSLHKVRKKAPILQDEDELCKT